MKVFAGIQICYDLASKLHLSDLSGSIGSQIFHPGNSGKVDVFQVVYSRSSRSQYPMAMICSVSHEEGS